MASSVSRGNYYKRKSREWFEKQGYETQLTEFVCGMIIKGRCIYKKIDVFSSDGISMNGDEIIFWNSKFHDGTDKSKGEMLSHAKQTYRKHKFPPNIKRQIILWELRKDPVIIECT